MASLSRPMVKSVMVSNPRIPKLSIFCGPLVAGVGR
jgi:hypothetical protein